MEPEPESNRTPELSATGFAGAAASEPAPRSIAFDETPSPMPAGLGPTQIPDPVWGKHNDPLSILNIFETHIVEL